MKGINYDSTGRRKNAIARVRLIPGSGKITINENSVMDYFKRETLLIDIEQPFKITKTQEKFDVIATVNGGGLSGQAGAVRLGIARALLVSDETFRPALRAAGLLTRDPRAKERRKYGLAKARKRYQYSKR